MRSRAVQAILVASLVLAACSNDGGKGSPSTTQVDMSNDSGEPPVAGGGSQYLATDDYTGPELQLLASRDTDNGIRIRVREYDAISMSVPVPTPSGWQAPGWCYPVSQYRLSVINGDAVGVLIGSLYGELHDGLNVSVFDLGSADGVPTRVLVLQVDPGVTKASVKWADGKRDSAEPKDGWALLAVSGDAGQGFDLTLDGPDGARTIADTDLMTGGSMEWQQQCTEPAATLPSAGAAPADAAATEQTIRGRFSELWSTVPFASKGADLLTDVTGVAEAIATLPIPDNSDVALGSTHMMNQLVFVSPTEAWFEYDIATPTTNFLDRFGRVELVDGVWKFDRAVVCQDLALSGAICQPGVAPLVPPIG